MSYETEVQAMFAAARSRMNDIAIGWALRVVADVVVNTPGPGNQSRDRERLYEATGRLRGSWTISLSGDGNASRWDGGPLDIDGSATVDAARQALKAFATLPVTFFLTSDVQYGFLVVNGLGPHSKIGPRDFPKDAERRAPGLLQDELEA